MLLWHTLSRVATLWLIGDGGVCDNPKAYKSVGAGHEFKDPRSGTISDIELVRTTRAGQQNAPLAVI